MPFRQNRLPDNQVIPVRPSDFSELSALHQTSFDLGWTPDALQNLFDSRKAWGFGIKSGTDWVSFVIAIPAVDDAEIATIATHPDFRGQHLAEDLVQAVAESARTSGHDRLLLEVAETNQSAISLYERCGFSIDGRRPRYYAQKNGPEIDAILMSLVLSGRND